MFKKSLSILLTVVVIMSAFTLTYSVEAKETDIATVGNPYIGGYANCTWTAWQCAYNDGYHLPDYSWGHAYQWYGSAQRDGYYCDKTPSAHSIIVYNATSTNAYGHVAYVADYNSSTNKIYAKEGGYLGGYHEGWIPAYDVNLIGYIHLGGGSDTEPPSLSNIYQDGFSNTGYTLHFTAIDNVGLKYATIYTNVNGENRKEENINLSGTRQDVSYSVRYSEFNTSTGYRHGIWVYDTAGNKYQSDWIVVDNEKPICENAYINYVTENSYRVNIVPKDNVGIKAVSVATWTQSNQSDLQWHDALYNGYGTYFIDIYRADYSATQNSYYFNHAYIYDFAGNWTLVSIPQDYKITSDTGKSVPEGEYRIVTTVNENRALDVEYGSADSGANIQIYSNLTYPNQTFLLTYLGNGFYTIANSRSKCVLDVAGDTYINNTNVQQFTANGGPNQDWMIKPSGDGNYYIISRTNGLALDVTNGEDKDGANVAVHTQNQSTAQKWKLRRVLNDNMVNVDAIISKENATVAKSSVTVTVDDNVLTEGVDYSLTTSYDSNTKALTATVIGLGNYCDTVTKTVTATLSVPKFLGDADGNGTVNITDATIIQRYLTGLSVSYPKETLMNADVNGDGVLTIIDATLIQRHVTMIDTPYPIGKPKT